jgi:hypothetical protein
MQRIREKRTTRNTLWVFVFVLAVLASAHADAVLLLEEPFGKFGSINPTGHAAVYLTRICASTPTRLRRCDPGESGIVLSRYHNVAGYDWLAIPLLPYLYAVESPSEIPSVADAQTVASLREAYRQAHLLAITSRKPDGSAPGREWTQLVGSAYDRKMFGFLVPTSPAQDDALIQQVNARNNQSHFNLFFHNCADFARAVLNFYYPRAIRRNLFADLGITTPKQTAKSLVNYCRKHADLACSSFVIPQVKGSIHRSEQVNGVIEAFLKTKQYVLPFAILHPAVTGSLAAAYLLKGRFNPQQNAQTFNIDHPFQPPADESPVATATYIDPSMTSRVSPSLLIVQIH